MNRQDEGVTVEVEKRLNDLFGEEGDGQSAFLENGSLVKDSPLMELKGIVLSIDWEITDEIMESFLDEINRLKEFYVDEKVPVLFLQLLGSVGKYIRNNKARAHPDSIKVLNSVYNSFERVLLDDSMSEADKRNSLYNEVNHFKKLKRDITEARGGEPGISEKPGTAVEPEPAIVPEPAMEPELSPEPSFEEVQDFIPVAEPDRPRGQEDMASAKEAFGQVLEETVNVIRDEFQALRAELQLWREERSRKYQIDASRIKGKEARFKCKGCGHAVTVKVSRPSEERDSALVDSETPVPPSPGPAPETLIEETETPLFETGFSPSPSHDPMAISPESAPEGPAEEPAAPPFKTDTFPSPPFDTAQEEPAEATKEEKKKKKKEKKASAPKRIGLRAKMFLLFFLVPILSLGAAGWLYIQQLTGLSSTITDESSFLVNEMAEEIIEMKAKTVARQVAMYLEANPGLHKTRFNDDPVFREIAVQPVGETGYTAVYELPDSAGIWRTWAHENPNIIGINMEDLRGPLGRAFPGFWRVFSGVREGRESRGYYTWQDVDGEFRDKFMVCTPVEGTRFIVAATTYMYEFTQPVQDLQSATKVRADATIITVITIIAATILLIGIIVVLFGHRLTGRVKSLTDVAERISVGDLDAAVEPGADDEIGDLGDAVSRMQDSIRISIERIRRRR